MAAIVGTNSYVDVVAADVYFSDKFGFGLWVDGVDKDGALISAAQVLDHSCNWYGYPCVADQPLSFPRTPDCPVVPDSVMYAQCEIAYLIVSTGSTTQDGGDALTELKAGSVTLKFKATSISNPLGSALIAALLSPFGLCKGSGSTSFVALARQ